MKSIVTVIFLLFFSSLTAVAEYDSTVAKRSQLFFGFSGQSYRGDLGGSFEKWTSGLHGGLRFYGEKRFSTQFQLGFGNVQGQVGSGQELPSNVNRFFNTNFVNVHIEIQYSIIQKESWRLFVSQGIGVFRFNPKDEEYNELVSRSDTRMEGETYGLVSLMLPTQVGVHYSLPKGFGIGAQIGFYNPLSDYIDNIGQLGDRKGFDNLLFFRAMFFVPIKLPSPALRPD